VWIATLKKNKALQTVSFTLFILFWLLALGDATGNATLKIFTGWEGIICSLSANYLAAAEILNVTYGKVVLPIG